MVREAEDQVVVVVLQASLVQCPRIWSRSVAADLAVKISPRPEPLRRTIQNDHQTWSPGQTVSLGDLSNALTLEQNATEPWSAMNCRRYGCSQAARALRRLRLSTIRSTQCTGSAGARASYDFSVVNGLTGQASVRRLRSQCCRSGTGSSSLRHGPGEAGLPAISAPPYVPRLIACELRSLQLSRRRPS